MQEDSNLLNHTAMENNKATLCGLKRENFQKVINGIETDLYVLTNDNGMEVAVTNYGGS